MKRIVLAALLGLGATTAYAGGEKREMGAHEHGHGKLGIAIEGKKVSMELIVPGADIVGFEHEAKSKKDKAAVAAAEKKLAAVLKVFTPPAGAGCKVTKAKVEFEVEGDHDDHAHSHGKKTKKKHDHGDKHSHGHDHGHKKKSAKKHDHDEETHAEFHANYILNCASPAKFTSLKFNYFGMFKGAEELDVQVVAPKGQTKYEVSRKKTTISLSGLM